MNYTTKKEFERACKVIPYWRNQESRWKYIAPVINIVKKINPMSILELGNMGISLTCSSDTMDVVDRNGVTYTHDATKIPWPIQDKKYDVFVALQVFEHLDDKRVKQIEIFNEAKRVSKNIIISIPYMWEKSRLKNHIGINDKTVLSWSCGLVPYYSLLIVGKFPRKIYFWRDV